MKIFLSAILIIVVSLPALAADDSVYNRVMEKRTIDCGYFVEPPFTLKDEATSEYSGLAVDLTKMIAKELDLKVNWKEQISFATFPEDLNANKYDMVCGSIFALPRAGRMDYTSPYAYVSMVGYVRPDNEKLDKAFNDVDWSDVTIVGLDGEGATTAAQKLLPEAKMQVLPQLSNISEMLLTVASGKADVAFVLPSVFEDFNKANPGKLRKAKLDKPLYSYAVGFGIAKGQEEYKALINNVLRQYTVSGELKSLFEKHDPDGFFEYPTVAKESVK